MGLFSPFGLDGETEAVPAFTPTRLAQGAVAEAEA